MTVAVKNTLPFERGDTFNEGSWLTLDDTVLKSLEGRTFWAKDTVHNSGMPVGLIAVKNDTGAAITIARKFCKFSATDKFDFPRRIGTFPNNTAGGICVALDDAYTVGNTIPDDDIFWCVFWGPVNVLTAATVASLATGVPVSSTNAGVINDAATVAAGSVVLGRLAAAASWTAATAATVFMAMDFKATPAAG